jgi:hypothetical protein
MKRWEMGDGRWEMEDGGWEMGNGGWEMGNVLIDIQIQNLGCRFNYIPEFCWKLDNAIYQRYQRGLG